MPHYLLFSGHMIDQNGRDPARFPDSKATAGGEAIYKTLQEAAAGKTDIKGIAAAASGGDILFHEACIKLSIPSEIYLGIPIEAFVKTSVAPAGPEWIGRYRKLIVALPVHILHPDATESAPSTIWEEANNWMLETALSSGGDHLTLIVLWDGNKGETGGTAHMVQVANDHRATVEIIDTHTL